MNIPSSFCSGITNLEIYERAGKRPIRYLLLERQLLFFGHVAELPDSDLLRQLIFVKGDVRLAVYNFTKRGNPHHCCYNCVFAHAMKCCGNLANLCGIIGARAEWKK